MLSPGVGGPVDFHQMTMSLADPSVIYGACAGLQISRDGGLSREMVGPGPDRLIDLAASARDPATLYAATEAGLLISADAGPSWSFAHPEPVPVSLVAVSSEGVVHAFMLGQGFLHATESELAWETVSAAFGDRFLLHLAIDPQDPARLFAVTQHGEIVTSQDGGAAWALLGAP